METSPLINILITAVLSFCGGFITGYLVRDLRLLLTGTRDQDNATWVIYVVSTVWAASMLVDIISPNYETSSLVHALMGLIVGFFFRPKINEKSFDDTKK